MPLILLILCTFFATRAMHYSPETQELCIAAMQLYEDRATPGIKHETHLYYFEQIIVRMIGDIQSTTLLPSDSKLSIVPIIKIFNDLVSYCASYEFFVIFLRLLDNHLVNSECAFYLQDALLRGYSPEQVEMCSAAELQPWIVQLVVPEHGRMQPYSLQVLNTVLHYARSLVIQDPMLQDIWHMRLNDCLLRSNNNEEQLQLLFSYLGKIELIDKKILVQIYKTDKEKIRILSLPTMCGSNLYWLAFLESATQKDS